MADQLCVSTRVRLENLRDANSVDGHKIHVRILVAVRAGAVDIIVLSYDTRYTGDTSMLDSGNADAADMSQNT